MNIGDTFGRLVVLELLPKVTRLGLRSRARVRCSCGNQGIVLRTNLQKGDTTSCGCLHREQFVARNLVHGNAVHGAHSPEYRSWTQAKKRVSNPNFHAWHRYGGRGITMCQEWLDSFAAFLHHIGPRPAPGYSLDRIDNDGNYEPGNVRWATQAEQVRNQARSNA